MTPTPHGQVPEALQLADEISKAGAFPAEIEHVAGDVSKNGAEVNTNVYAELPPRYYLAGGVEKTWDQQQMCVFADATHALRAQQPAPDYEAGWKGGYKHGAWSTQQPAPATQQAGEVRRAELVPGVMHCAKCKFQLNRVTLCVSDGNAYAGNNKTEPCPNGCGPLWPVTWEQEAKNCWKALEEMHERLMAAATPQPSPTPQANSQPAHQRDTGYPPLPECDATTIGLGAVWNWHSMRAYVDADRTARTQADSVCYDYAKQIAESMWATHYKADAPHWESCDSLMGVLSQISNMMCGLSRAPAGSVTAPAGGAEEVDKALNDYAQAFMARAMGWTRENGDAMPDARTKLYSAISSYARGLFTTSPTPQADSQPAATGRIAELEDALSSCLQLVNQLNEHHIPDGCSRLIRHIKDAAATVSKAQASAPADSVLEDAARLTTEQEYAIRQGHEIAASEAYFGARSKLDTNRNHNIFTAGFERGWDAARKQGGA